MKDLENTRHRLGNMLVLEQEVGKKEFWKW
jgi:hypothetical protein